MKKPTGILGIQRYKDSSYSLSSSSWLPFGGSRLTEYLLVSSKGSLSVPFIVGQFFEGYEEDGLDGKLEDDELPTSRPPKRKSFDQDSFFSVCPG